MNHYFIRKENGDIVLDKDRIKSIIVEYADYVFEEDEMEKENIEPGDMVLIVEFNDGAEFNFRARGTDNFQPLFTLK